MTHDIRRLLLKPAKPLDFSPGQYATLQFGAGLTRPYSMANVSGEDELEFHVRLVPDGRVTGHIENELAVAKSIQEKLLPKEIPNDPFLV